MAARSNYSPATGGQFRATKVWKTLIEHLHENANVKRRRNVKKSYDECFTGSNAVDVLFRFVRLHPEQFSSTGSITRDNIIRLCQAFLDNSVFEPAGGSNESNKQIKFDDSTTSLYQFSSSTNEMNLKPLTNRQVLREIDGDLRNGLDHISISTENTKGNTPRGKNILIPTRKHGTSRSRFPSFGGLSAQSFKGTFMTAATMHSSGSDEENATDQRAGRKLKRSSSLVGVVVKRSSSDSNLRRGVSSASSSSDTDPDGKKKSDDLNRGGKLRLSQRLSFRKKSLSSEQETNIKPVNQEQGTPLKKKKVKPPTPAVDPRRKSLAVRCEKPTRSLRRLLSTPSLHPKNKMTSQRPHCDEPKNLDRIPPLPLHHRRDTNNNNGGNCIKTPTHRHLRCERNMEQTPQTTSFKSKTSNKMRTPFKDASLTPSNGIKETPSRLKSTRRNLSSLSGLTLRMTSKRKSLGRSDASSSRITGSCVIKNQSVANGNAKESEKDSTGGKTKNVERKLSHQEILHLRRECVRVRLLQILDLQFVDSLITSPTFDKKTGWDLFGGAGSHGVQYSEVVAAYNNEDSWISSALSVLQHLPNGYEILCKHARDTPAMKKIKLFFSISDYYKSLSQPLIDESYSEIIEALITMLETKPVPDCLEAIQLFFHLLPEPRLFELRDLFTFLYYVVANSDVLLTPKCNNKVLVVQTFVAPVLHRVDIVPDRRISGLFLFVMEQRHRAFRLPTSVASTMERKRKLLETGEVESPTCVPDSVFCRMITSKEYNRQRVEFTQHHISELARALATNQS
uniref:DEP domain-containing protein n=4 Tax=Ciona intestinalis TaxID=7719 RepID=F6YRU6_CIOIN